MKSKNVFHNSYNVVCCILAIVFLFTDFSYANSSWHWLTFSPMKLLPFAIILTLLIEVVGIIIFGQVKDTKNVLEVVTLANVISFIFPYVERANRMKAVAGSWFWAVRKAFDSGPYYMVLTGYLILTILIEVPLVYKFLSRHSLNRKRLLQTIILVNIITTLIVAGIERYFCYGRW